MKREILVFSTTLLAAFSGLFAGSGDDILIADFEGTDFGPWDIIGVAFGPGPARSGEKSSPDIKGFEGHGFASSYFGGHRAEGEITSAPFEVERGYVNFLLGGGKTSDIYIGLLVNGVLTKSALPTNLERLEWFSWDVSTLVGQNARIQILDDRSGHPQGYLFVDSIHQSNKARATPLATMTLNREILNAHSLNPDPRRLPTLGVWERGEDLLVSARFPELLGFTCDSWCYEISDIEFIGAGAFEGGIVEMEHRVGRDEHVFRFKTEVVPTPGTVEFIVKAVADPGNAESLPDKLPTPNICFQLRRAPHIKNPVAETTGYVRSEKPHAP